jgi:PEP-CTERM motif
MLRNLLGLGAAATLALSAFAGAAPIDAQGGSLQEVAHYTIGERTAGSAVVAPGAVYSDVTSFTGSAAKNGGATAATPSVTNGVADDLTPIAGGLIGQYEFTVANLGSAAINARVRVRYYDSDGAGGGPGTLLSALSFSPITFATGVTTFTTGALGANSFTIPNHKIWGLTFFDNSGATAAQADLNNLGEGLFNPPDVGSSADVDFLSASTNQPYNANPAGSIVTSPFSGNPVANYGYELVAAPEPASIGLVSLGLLGLAARRRKA